MEEAKKPNKVMIGIIVVVVLAAITAAVILLNKKEEAPTSSNTTTSQKTADTSASTSGNSSTTAASSGSYKDGAYQASGTYKTPGGDEKVTVKMTLKDGVVQAVDTTNAPTTREAQEYQGKFLANYKDLVVGKKIDDVQVSRVAGSSLTSGGFNDALDQIKTDAKA